MKNRKVLLIIRLILLALAAVCMLFGVFTKKMGIIWFVGLFFLLAASVLGLITDIKFKK